MIFFKLSHIKKSDAGWVRLFPSLGSRSCESRQSLVGNMLGFQATKLMRSGLPIIMSHTNDVCKQLRFEMADPSRIRLFPPTLGPRIFESPHSLVWYLQGLKATKLMGPGLAVMMSQTHEFFKLSHIQKSDPGWRRVFPAPEPRIMKVLTAKFRNYKDSKRQSL